MNEALAAADRVRNAWAGEGAWQLAQLLRRGAASIAERADHIVRLLTEEQDKPLTQSGGEVAPAVEQFEWYADEARRLYG